MIAANTKSPRRATRRCPGNLSVHKRGFTLIEVIVALAILATTLYGGFFLLNRTTVNTFHLRDSVLANWVATNVYANTILTGATSEQEEIKNQSVVMYGEEFLVTVNKNSELTNDTQINAAVLTATDNNGASEGGAGNDESTVTTQVLTIVVSKPSAPDSPLESLVVNL